MQKFTTVPEFLESLDDTQKAQVELLRKIILTTEPSLVENIKWNAPNYVYRDQDRITFSLFNKEKKVKLILHKGAKEKEDKKAKPIMIDETKLVSWASNIRGIIMFDDLKHVVDRTADLTQVLKMWLSL